MVTAVARHTSSQTCFETRTDTCDPDHEAKDLGITLPSAQSTQLDKDFFSTPVDPDGTFYTSFANELAREHVQPLVPGDGTLGPRQLMLRFCDHEFDSADENKDGKAHLCRTSLEKHCRYCQ